MSEDNTKTLIDRLARDLAPVKPIPRLRAALVGIVALWILVGGVALAIRGLPENLAHVLATNVAFDLVLAGLVLTGVGGLVWALAASVPGREGPANWGRFFAFSGVVLGAGLGGFAIRGEIAAPSSPFASDMICLGWSGLIALIPGVAAVAYVARAFPTHRGWILAAGAAGATALGAIIVHLSCPYMGFRHLLFAHALAPAIVAIVVTIPMLAVMRILERKPSQS